MQTFSFQLKTFKFITMLLIFINNIAFANPIVCNGPYANKRLSVEEVYALILQANTAELNLCGANLTNLDLSGIKLKHVNLSYASLNDSILKDASLQFANLYNANLNNTVLINADLQKANLELASLKSANLTQANLQEARLRNAIVKNASFRQAILTLSDLDEIQAQEASFNNAEMSFCSIRNANFNFANISNATIYNSNLQGSSFVSSTLVKTQFMQSNLSNIDFSMANLSFASLKNANLSNAIFYQVNLLNTDYRPQYHTMPDLFSLATAYNLATIESFDRSIGNLPLLELRAAYRTLGLVHMYKLINSMLQKSIIMNAFNDGPSQKLKAFFWYLLFECTCDYGNTPSNACGLLLHFMLIFAIAYTVLLYCAPIKHSIIEIDANSNPIPRQKKQII